VEPIPTSILEIVDSIAPSCFLELLKILFLGLSILTFLPFFFLVTVEKPSPSCSIAFYSNPEKLH
jgi:hypothetical protein